MARPALQDPHNFPNLKDLGNFRNVDTIYENDSSKLPSTTRTQDDAYSHWAYTIVKAFVLPRLIASDEQLNELLREVPMPAINEQGLTVRELIAVVHRNYEVKMQEHFLGAARDTIEAKAITLQRRIRSNRKDILLMQDKISKKAEEIDRLRSQQRQQQGSDTEYETANDDSDDDDTAYMDAVVVPPSGKRRKRDAVNTGSKGATSRRMKSRKIPNLEDSMIRYSSATGFVQVSIARRMIARLEREIEADQRELQRLDAYYKPRMLQYELTKPTMENHKPTDLRTDMGDGRQFQYENDNYYNPDHAENVVIDEEKFFLRSLGSMLRAAVMVQDKPPYADERQRQQPYAQPHTALHQRMLKLIITFEETAIQNSKPSTAFPFVTLGEELRHFPNDRKIVGSMPEFMTLLIHLRMPMAFKMTPLTVARTHSIWEAIILPSMKVDENENNNRLVKYYPPFDRAVMPRHDHDNPPDGDDEVMEDSDLEPDDDDDDGDGEFDDDDDEEGRNRFQLVPGHEYRQRLRERFNTVRDLRDDIPDMPKEAYQRLFDPARLAQGVPLTEEQKILLYHEWLATDTEPNSLEDVLYRTSLINTEPILQFNIDVHTRGVYKYTTVGLNIPRISHKHGVWPVQGTYDRGWKTSAMQDNMKHVAWPCVHDWEPSYDIPIVEPWMSAFLINLERMFFYRVHTHHVLHQDILHLAVPGLGEWMHNHRASFLKDAYYIRNIPNDDDDDGENMGGERPRQQGERREERGNVVAAEANENDDDVEIRGNDVRQLPPEIIEYILSEGFSSQLSM